MNNKKDWIEKHLSQLENLHQKDIKDIVESALEFAELVEEYEILFNGANLMEDLELYYT